MKTYLVPWNPTKIDELNLKLPKILKDVRFELETTKLRVASSRGGENFEIAGQPLVKIIVDVSEKEYFVEKLKTGTKLDESFPGILSRFIFNNLQITVY